MISGETENGSVEESSVPEEEHPHQAISPGDAAQLLNDPTLQRVLQTLRKFYFGRIERSQLDAKDSREDSYRMLKAILEIIRILTHAKNKGKTPRVDGDTANRRGVV